MPSHINTKYKDRLFNFIFGNEANRAWTLELYNAVNHTSYTDPSEIEYTTIDDFLYMGARNDTAFLIADEMNIYEHQSTLNPNMPLREFSYLNEIFAGAV